MEATLNNSLAFPRTGKALVPKPPAATPQPGLQQLSAEALLGISPRPAGLYYLGAEFNPDNGLMPILCSSGRSPFVLATAEQDGTDSLLALAITAALTSCHLGQADPLVVTATPRVWANVIRYDRILRPAQFQQAIPYLQTHKPGNRKHGLIIIDDLVPNFEITAQDLLGLAASSRLNLLVTALPEYSAPLAHSIQSARLVIGNLSREHSRAVLGNTPPLEQYLAYGQFAIRHQSRWLVFSTITQS
jgi:hypothetical protein